LGPVDKRGSDLRWSNIASGANDNDIDVTAGRLKSIASTVLVSFSHEPEKDYRAHGSAASFAAAFRHVHDRMKADGATNVRWVWNVMGLDTPLWKSRYKVMWPGASYVDWVAWDPYNWSTCRGRLWRSFSQTVKPFYDWLESNGYGKRPFMLAEYGSIENPGKPAGKADWFHDLPSALKSMPNLRALVYFDLPAPPANCNWQIATSAQATTAFGALARSSPFAPTAKLVPAVPSH
jgi:hypothetical protein